MRSLPIYAIIFVAIMVHLGCQTAGPPDAQSISRPLGRDIATYQSPAVKNSDRNQPATEQPLEPDAPITLQQSLALALLHNPELQAFSWQLRAEEANILQQRLIPNPVLIAKVENFAGPRPMNEFESSMMTFRISQLVELGDKRMKRTRLAEQNHALSVWDYEAKRLGIITETARRYIEVSADQRRVNLTVHTLDLAEQMYSIVENRARIGVIPTVEVDKALVRVSTEQILLDKAERKLEASRQQLTAMWGNPAPRFTQVLGELKAADDIPAQDQLMKFVSQNPDLARWSSEIAQRQAALELAQSLAIPSVTVGGGLRRFNATDENALVFEVGLPLQIIDRNQGGRQQARYNLLKAQSQQKNAEIKIQTLLIDNYKKLAAAHYETITLRDVTLPAARSAYESARQAFENGITNYIDVLDAERTLVNTERQYIESLAVFYQTHATLEGVIGESLDNINPQTGHSQYELIRY
jgi:cobalt-zinc-cadmium efflux system outer membrane protein